MSPEYFTYRKFLAIKNHFTTPSYDYFLYSGKTRTSEEKFKANKNYKQFISLSQQVSHHDIVEFMAVNFAYATKTIWVTDLLTREASDRYKKFRAYIEASTYHFEEDLKKLEPVGEAILVQQSFFPIAATKAMAGLISLETLCIMQALYDIVSQWNLHITEKYIWPGFSKRVTKFTPFVRCDKNVMLHIFDKYLETKYDVV
jgi:hypothetical protein